MVKIESDIFIFRGCLPLNAPCGRSFVLDVKVNPAQIGRLQAIPKYIFFKERVLIEKGVCANKKEEKWKKRLI